MTADIERMAREAGGDFHCDRAWLVRFAALVRAHALEDAARVLDLRARSIEAARAHADGSLQGANPRYFEPLLQVTADGAAAIRALATQAQRETP